MKLAGKPLGMGWAVTTWVKRLDNGKWVRGMQGEPRMTRNRARMEVVDRWGGAMTRLEVHEAARTGTYQPTPNIRVEVNFVQGAA